MVDGGLPRLDGNPVVHIYGAVGGEGVDGGDDGGAGVLVGVPQPRLIRDAHPRRVLRRRRGGVVRGVGGLPAVEAVLSLVAGRRRPGVASPQPVLLRDARPGRRRRRVPRGTEQGAGHHAALVALLGVGGLRRDARGLPWRGLGGSVRIRVVGLVGRRFRVAASGRQATRWTQAGRVSVRLDVR